MPSRLGCALALCLLASPALAQKQGGTLRIPHRENPPSASIHEEATISTDMPFMGVFNNLVVFDSASRQDRLDHIVPELATAWKWSEDGRTLTFTLRDGVKWHDGKPFTSADVKCTWDTLIGQRDSGMRKNPRKPWYFNLTGITTSGDREVSFHLTDPQPSLLAMLAGGFSPVYPCHVSFAQMRTHPIGTGPFKFADWKQNNTIKLVKNPDYWKPGRHEQSQMADMEQRRKLVWQIDKALQEDGARPVLDHGWAATCWSPPVKGIHMAVNSIYNRWRMEDLWLDR